MTYTRFFCMIKKEYLTLGGRLCIQSFGKETLADNIILLDIKAPRVAAECLPGQFIIATTDEVGERIPLTICDYGREKETVTIVVQTIGAGTERMMSLNEGDALDWTS